MQFEEFEDFGKQSKVLADLSSFNPVLPNKFKIHGIF